MKNEKLQNFIMISVILLTIFSFLIFLGGVAETFIMSLVLYRNVNADPTFFYDGINNLVGGGFAMVVLYNFMSYLDNKFDNQ